MRRQYIPGAYGSAFANIPTWSIFDYDILGWFYKWFLLIYTIIRLIVDIIILIVRFIFWTMILLWQWGGWIAWITILWYLIVIYWPYVIDVVLTVVIPILNVLIILFNFFFELFIIIWDVVMSIWNAIVPFIGMLLYVIMNIVLTILTDLFNVIGSINWEPIMNALMEILNVLVEIVAQILLVLIKVGSEILKFVAMIIGPILEIFMEYVKIWADVLSWVFKLLFKILEPILLLLGALFGSGGSSSGSTSSFTGQDFTSKGSSSTARRLLELERFKLSTEEEAEIIAEFDQHFYSLPDGLTDSERKKLELLVFDKAYEEHDDQNNHINDVLDNLMQLSRQIDEEEYLPTKKRKREHEVVFVNTSQLDDLDVNTGRKLQSIEKPWKLGKPGGLKFVDNEESKKESKSEHLDDMAHTVAHYMYMGSKNIPLDDYKLARDSAKRILKEHSNKPHFSLNAILQNIGKKWHHLMPAHEERVSAVRYNAPEHPRKLVPSFHEETTKRYKEQLHANGGRKLMANYHDVKHERFKDIRLHDAKNILKRYDEYHEYHEQRVKVAMVVYSAATRTLNNAMREVVTPENILKHYTAILDSLGYQSIQDVRQTFIARYGDPLGFIMNISHVTNHPIVRMFKRLDPSRHESPFYHDWAIEHQKLSADRAARTGRKLFTSEGNVQGSGDSTSALSGFAQLAGLNCYSSPKNPLCMPLIPLSTKVKIPLIKLTPHQITEIKSSTIHCSPWRFTNCIICADRIWNAMVEICFLISANPYTNYPLATLLEVIPSAKVLVDWIFIVPKYGYPTTYQWVCFAYHLFDLYEFIVLLWLAWHFLTPVWEIVSLTYDNIYTLIYSGREPSWFARCTARAIRTEMANIQYDRWRQANLRPLGAPRLPPPRVTDSDESDDESESDEDLPRIGGTTMRIQGRVGELRQRNGKKGRRRRPNYFNGERLPKFYMLSASDRRRLDVLEHMAASSSQHPRELADQLLRQYHMDHFDLSGDYDEVEHQRFLDDLMNDPLYLQYMQERE
jgi:hypothetical protein